MTKRDVQQQDDQTSQSDLPTPPSQGWLPAQRRDMILNLLLRDDVVRVPDLAEMMSTTDITIRRDLDALSKAGLIRRVRGGALSLNSADAAPDPEDPSRGKRTEATERRDPSRPMFEDRLNTDLYTADSLMPTISSGSSVMGVKKPSRGIIGVALPEPSFFWPAVTEHIRQIARDRYNMDVVARETSYEDYPETGILDELAKAEHLRGIIAAPSINQDIAKSTWKWLGNSSVPITVLEREPPLWSEYFIDSVHTNHPVGVRKGLLHFKKYGHTRIGLALGYTPTSNDIELGWHLMMQAQVGVEEAFLLTRKEAYEANDVNDIADTILRTGATAVLVHPDYLSIAVAQALEQRGKHIPRDVSMISIDGYTTPSTRPLTVLRSSEFDLAQSALRLLVKRMSDSRRRTEHIYIDPQLIDRKSVTNTRQES